MSIRHIALIGLGQMGGAIAWRLHGAGYAVRGHDAHADTSQAHAARGLPVAASAAEAAAGCDMVMTSLPHPAAVREVWLGDSGLAARIAPGTACVELSSIDPATMKDVAAAVTARGATMLDCPVSGSPAEALEGRLVLLVGGSTQDLEAARPVLQVLGTSIQHAGDVGAGKVVKIVNNMMTMANILAAAEAFSLGMHAGVNAQTLFDILSVSGGRSAQFLKRFPWAVAGDFEPRFKMELGEKDLALGIDLGLQTGQPTPLADIARRLYARALDEGHRGRDIVALLDMYQSWLKPER